MRRAATSLHLLRPPSLLLGRSIQRDGNRHASTTAAAATTPDGTTPARAAAAENKHPRTTPFLLTLERSVGARGPVADAPLCATGAFGAEVSPDLPIVTTWGGLGRALGRRAQAAIALLSPAGRRAAAAEEQQHHHDPSDPLIGQGDQTAWRVTTVAVQLRSPQELEGRLLSAGGVVAATATTTPTTPTPSPPRPASDALLLLSGSHPVRSIPPLASAIAGARLDSLDLLRMARRLRDDPLLQEEEGGGGGPGSSPSAPRRRLPPSLALWAVANPVTEKDAARSAAKAAAGAEALLTQPPLDWDAFERWLADARRRGLGGGQAAAASSSSAAQQHRHGTTPPPTGSARLVVGFPALSSSANAAFWVELCGARRDGPAAATVKAFADAERRLGGASSPGFQAWALDWNRDLARRLVGKPGVGGLHVMPVTAAGKRLALALLEEGVLTPPERARGGQGAA
jgi:hypothetical protein